MFSDWLKDHAAIFFAALAGGVVQVTTAWRHPKIAARQFVICMIMASVFGPALYKLFEAVSPVDGDEMKYAVITAVGLGGVYISEAFNVLWKKWSENPVLPFPWRKP